TLEVKMGNFIDEVGVDGVVHGRAQVKSSQGPFYRSLEHGIDGSFVVKFDLGLRRMHIDVYMPGVQFYKKDKERKAGFGDQAMKCLANGVIQVAAFDKAVVDEEKLVAAGLPGKLRFSDVAGDLYVFYLLA